MNRLTSQQRKLLYLGGIVVLMIPIILLGAPATPEKGSGGVLARMRSEYKLGEATLGDIDPTSATMNLVLLGLRGIATDLLWIQAIEHKEKKNWPQLRATVKSITLLQPHYLKVWDFQGWNLAFNVSAEWDDVRDRFYWVKEGAKFLQQGIEKNRDFPQLYYYKGRIIGQKIGRADEWRFFREYFKHDPDPSAARYENGPDKDLNPDGKDNYLVAKEIYTIANEKELLPDKEQHIEARFLFRSKPARSQIDYAMALHREGKFGEVTRQAWEQAYRDWTGVYGREQFETEHGPIPMDPSEQELRELAADRNVPYEVLHREVVFLQNTSNYLYWKRRTDAERHGLTDEAHRELHLAKVAFFQGRDQQAKKLVLSGLKKYEEAYNRYFRYLREDREGIEEGLKGVLLMHNIFNLQGQPVPDDYPLKELWVQQMAVDPGLRDDLEFQLRSEAAALDLTK